MNVSNAANVLVAAADVPANAANVQVAAANVSDALVAAAAEPAAETVVEPKEPPKIGLKCKRDEDDQVDDDDDDDDDEDDIEPAAKKCRLDDRDSKDDN